jgi:micrococcal nuclease
MKISSMIWIALIMSIIPAYCARADSWLEPRLYKDNLCYDGDTCYVTATVLPESLQKMSVRILGIDTPEIRGECDEEKALAKQGKVFANDLFKAATLIEYRDLEWDKYGGRILSNVYLDGELYSKKIIDAGLARPYFGDKKEPWCK